MLVLVPVMPASMEKPSLTPPLGNGLRLLLKGISEVPNLCKQSEAEITIMTS